MKAKTRVQQIHTRHSECQKKHPAQSDIDDQRKPRSRLAGDEFIVLLESLAFVQQAEAVAEKILMLMNKPWLLNGDPLVITTSIGITFDEQHIHTSDTLIAHADTALYSAKAAGRNPSHTSCH